MEELGVALGIINLMPVIFQWLRLGKRSKV